MKLNVLSLFDGLGGARIALDRMGIECNYYASEVDKYAIKVSSANYPDIVHLGDVCNVKASGLPKIDLLCGGSPCQDLSVAKSNREGLNGEKSRLFYEYLRLLEELKPRYFVLENVFSMGKENRDIITKLLGYSPVMINSALLTAQNRKRYYWSHALITQPMDKGIYLKDIIEPGRVDEKYYCKSGTLKNYDGKEPLQSCGIYTIPRGYNQGGIRITNKAPSITSSSFEQNNLLVLNPIKLGHFGQNKRQDRVYSVEGKSVTLCGNGGGQGANTGLYYTHEGIRKLTPLECERLQGIPERYTDRNVSNTQRYKMIGNGFTVPVIEHILSFAIKKS